MGSLQQAVEMTVSSHLQDLERQFDANQDLLKRTESLLDDVISYRHLTEQELAFFQQQERHWCKDLHEPRFPRR